MTAAPGSLLHLGDVHARFPDGTAALRGVSLSIDDPRDRVAVLGGNGAGKTSLFLALAGFLPFEGSIRVLGEPLGPGSVAAIRRRIGFVFERPEDQLFLGSLGEDVAFGPRNLGLDEGDVQRRVARALEAVGLAGLSERPPDRLSQGEARLAALATALALEPRILVLDEPTANLDARGRRRVLEAIDRFEGPVLLLTHDLEGARAVSKRSIVLLEGRVVSAGPTERVLSDSRAQRALGLDPQGIGPGPRHPKTDSERGSW